LCDPSTAKSNTTRSTLPPLLGVVQYEIILATYFDESRKLQLCYVQISPYPIQFLETGLTTLLTNHFPLSWIRQHVVTSANLKREPSSALSQICGLILEEFTTVCRDNFPQSRVATAMLAEYTTRNVGTPLARTVKCTNVNHFVCCSSFDSSTCHFFVFTKNEATPLALIVKSSFDVVQVSKDGPYFIYWWCS
jgi:hypothetical protein